MYLGEFACIGSNQDFSKRGDVTLGWTEDQVDLLTEIIQAKMDEGYVFFHRDVDGRQVRLQSIDPVKTKTIDHIIIDDKDAQALLKEGKIGIVSAGGGQGTTGRAKIADARTAATSHTVTTRPLGGG